MSAQPKQDKCGVFKSPGEIQKQNKWLRERLSETQDDVDTLREEVADLKEQLCEINFIRGEKFIIDLMNHCIKNEMGGRPDGWTVDPGQLVADSLKVFREHPDIWRQCSQSGVRNRYAGLIKKLYTGNTAADGEKLRNSLNRFDAGIYTDVDNKRMRESLEKIFQIIFPNTR